VLGDETLISSRQLRTKWEHEKAKQGLQVILRKRLHEAVVLSCVRSPKNNSGNHRALPHRADGDVDKVQEHVRTQSGKVFESCRRRGNSDAQLTMTGRAEMNRQREWSTEKEQVVGPGYEWPKSSSQQ
jgi:hypothetical protein